MSSNPLGEKRYSGCGRLKSVAARTGFFVATIAVLILTNRLVAAEQLDSSASASPRDPRANFAAAHTPQRTNFPPDLVADAYYPSWFIGGVATASVLLSFGFGLGIWLGTRSRAPAAAQEADGRLKVILDLLQCANGVAGDVSEFRQFYNLVSKVAESANERRGQGKFSDSDNRLSQIVTENQHLQKRLDAAETALKSQATTLVEYLNEARTDGLTRLPNRRAFDDEVNRRLAEWRRSRNPFSVIMLDVDHFKQFNDQQGHLAGDSVLFTVAQTLRQAMRQVDFVARFGGEEFAVVLVGVGMKDAIQAADRARAAIEKAHCEYEGRPMSVTVSCGVAQAQPSEPIAGLLKRADTALYASKDAGRNASHWHDGQRCIQIRNGMLLTNLTPRSAFTSKTPDIIPIRFQGVCQALTDRLDEILEE